MMATIYLSRDLELCDAGVKKPRALTTSEQANLAKGIFSDEEDEDISKQTNNSHKKGTTVKHEPEVQGK